VIENQDVVRHAVRAAEMLASLDQLDDRLGSLSPDERLQMVATDGFKRVNADMDWTAKLALAHALTALALAAVVGEELE
jgi:hypothetical protein